MSPMRRVFPFPLWLAAYLMILLLFLPGLLLLRQDAAQAASMPDFSLLADRKALGSLAPGWKTALNAAVLCLIIGYPIGCLLALWRRRTVFMAFLMPVLLLGGTALLYGRRLAPLLPRELEPVLLLAEGWLVPPTTAIALVLLPLMMQCTCSFAAAADPALYGAARGLGASRLRAFFTLILPRTLKGALAGFIIVFFPALGLVLVSGQDAPALFSLAVPVCAAFLFITYIVLTLCLLALKKARSVRHAAYERNGLSGRAVL